MPRIAELRRVLIVSTVLAAFCFANPVAPSSGSDFTMKGPREELRVPEKLDGLETSSVRAAFLGLIGFYQHFVSPVGGPYRCGFGPSCSRYGHQAIREQGTVVGIMMTADPADPVQHLRRGPDTRGSPTESSTIPFRITCSSKNEIIATASADTLFAVPFSRLCFPASCRRRGRPFYRGCPAQDRRRLHGGGRVLSGGHGIQEIPDPLPGIPQRRTMPPSRSPWPISRARSTGRLRGPSWQCAKNIPKAATRSRPDISRG